MYRFRRDQQDQHFAKVSYEDRFKSGRADRSYLHSLEQEVQQLRAQVASLSGGSALPTPTFTPTGGFPQSLPVPKSERGTPSNLNAIPFSRSDLMIDPSLQHEGPDSALRSPWDSPTFFNGRRHSDFPFPPGGTPSEPPRSPYGGRLYASQQPAATSLGRMVHDAALRTGHAQNPTASMNPAAPSSAAGSEKGSIIDSPHDHEGVSPQDAHSGARRQMAASPLATSASVSSRSSKKRSFAVPPLPPQPAVERLVAAYVDFVGVTAPIIHIPTLGKQLIRIREGREVDQSDIFVVMMVLGELRSASM